MIRTADVDNVFVKRMTARLSASGYNGELITALEQFGGPMFDEILGRIAALETKAISILGWSTALLGFLLLAVKPNGSAGRYLLRGATVAAVLAIIAASDAARARQWRWPTVEHWFCEDEFESPPRLRAQHLMALLRTYQAHATISKRQAIALRISQAAIAVAGIFVASAILFGLTG